MTVLHCAGAEWLKLRRRPATMILTAVMALVVLLFGYVLLYTIVTQAPAGAAGVDRVGVLTALSLVNLPGQVLGLTVGFGGPIGLIIGALSVGSEFNWRTYTTTTTQRPGRITLLGGQALALLGVCALFAITAFVAGAAGAYLITLFEPVPTTAPALGDLAGAFGAAVLVIAVWCGLGMCLAMLFRGSGWAIGIGLLYTFALEQVLTLLPLPDRAGDLVDAALLGTNANALVQWLSPDVSQALGAAGPDIAPLQAALVLVAYLAVALLIASAVFTQRDIA